ncbi:DUF3253 domain-containing protein [Rhodovarius crocodyli]|uniref:DUF3253 domain-containing protein n=1 Tax=Rhodovarius crocodyli TaxID=1979269 RepID=A0A437MME0_9PROT|nr:DUF3253 domain-containing protein [Rhodovarius crocodyli]RVT98811.1 DUF3253 domain-containing protein [Rhodovarius crocodyli]
MSTMPSPEAISDEILRQTQACGQGRSICPSEVARALNPRDEPDTWQRLMTPVRQAAVKLAEQGQISILRKGKPVPVEEVRGVIRLSLPRGPAAGEGQ